MREARRLGLKVLVAHHDRGVRTSLAMCLDEHGFDVQTAGSGRTAFNTVTRGACPDIFLLGVRLHDWSGPELAQAMRRRGGRAPVILMWTSDVPDEWLTSIGAPRAHYLSLPCSSEELLQGLWAALAAHDRELMRLVWHRGRVIAGRAPTLDEVTRHTGLNMLPNGAGPENFLEIGKSGHEQRVIVHVDDEPSIRSVMKALLGNTGFVVHSYENGEAAVQDILLKKLVPDLFLIDWTMRPGNGLWLSQQLRSRGFRQPILLTWSMKIPLEALLSIPWPAPRVVTLPFKVHELLDVIQLSIEESALGSSCDTHVKGEKDRLI